MNSKLFIPVLFSIILFSCNSKTTEEASSDEGFVIKRGVNLSHWLSQTKVRGKDRAAYTSEKDLEIIAEMGFDHVRIPFDEMQMWDEEGNKETEAFKLLHRAIGWALEQDLRVIVDLHVLRSHHFNKKDIPLWTDPQAQEYFWKMWEQLSAELINYPVDKLAYELMNEAVAPHPDQWNKLIAKGIETVRKNEPERVIVVGSNRWQQVHTFKDLKVPEGDKILILSFHYYEPFILTHYRTGWTGILQEYHGPVHYPGYTVDSSDYAGLEPELIDRLKASNDNWSKELFERDMMKAKKVAEAYGLQLFCGEFGAYPSTPIETRIAYYKDIISVFDKLDIAWTHWNYKNDFSLVDAETLEPIEEITSVLMGE